MTPSSFPDIGQIIGAKWELWLLSNIWDERHDKDFGMIKIPPDSNMLVISRKEGTNWFKVLDIGTNATGWLEMNDQLGIYLYCQHP